jgi:hypothetical protein
MPIARTAAVLALTLSLSPVLRAADSGDDFLGTGAPPRATPSSSCSAAPSTTAARPPGCAA